MCNTHSLSWRKSNNFRQLWYRFIHIKLLITKNKRHMYNVQCTLKVPKRENFFCSRFFILYEPIWVCDLWTEPRNGFVFLFMVLISMNLGFLPHAESSVKKLVLRLYKRESETRFFHVPQFSPGPWASLWGHFKFLRGDIGNWCKRHRR